MADHHKDRMAALLDKMIEEWPEVMTDEAMVGTDAVESLVGYVMEARDITGKMFLMPAPLPAGVKVKWRVPVVYTETSTVGKDFIVMASDKLEAQELALEGTRQDESDERFCEVDHINTIHIDTTRKIEVVTDG